MGFHLGTSLSAGPFRVRLSTRGIGMSAGVPGFRVGMGPRANRVSVTVAGIRYSTTLGGRPRRRTASARATSPGLASTASGAAYGSGFAPPPVEMSSTTGEDATTLQPTGPGDVVEQLNKASARTRFWPAAAVLLGILVLVTLALPQLAILLLLLGTPAVVWLRYWEAARRTVVIFYEVEGPVVTWYEGLVSGHPALAALGGAWRIQARGDLHDTHQRKVNSGASSLVQRLSVGISLTPPRTLATNIAVPSIICGRDALLLLPDRILVRTERRWTDVGYDQLGVSAGTTRFIETGPLPRDGQQVDWTWEYVNVKGGPDRRFANNRQLPVMRYGTLDLTSPTGLRWSLQLSRADVAEWFATIVRGPARPAPAPARVSPAVVLPPVPGTAPAARSERSAFARPGGGSLFGYADLLDHMPGLHKHDGMYAVLDFETTGFAPGRGDRIIEIAIARVDRSGVIHDEFATLLDPEGRDTGAVFIHGITNEAVRGAPRFADVLGDIMLRLDGCVVVAHNAAFEERFLAAELARAGVRADRFPALCTLWLGQQVFATPNHKLPTLARHAGVPLPDMHSALGDARAVAALLPRMLDGHRSPLGFPCAPYSTYTLPIPAAGMARPRTRATGIKRGTDGWMASILARLPMSAAEAGDADTELYLSCLADALADGKIVADEARALADMAGTAGLGSAQVAALNQRFLESMREAAFADSVLTAEELRSLRTAAKSLGVPDYFDDLTAEVPTEGRRRCGHCRGVGHYRSRCPALHSQLSNGSASLK